MRISWLNPLRFRNSRPTHTLLHKTTKTTLTLLHKTTKTTLTLLHVQTTDSQRVGQVA